MTKEKKSPSKETKQTSEDKIKELEAKLEESQNDFLRSRADFENFRKRKEKEIEETRDRAIISFVQDILPSIDNFELSLKMTDNKEMFIKGVEMILKNLLDTLKDHHFEEFEPKLGESFDPLLHEPLLIEDNEAESGKILGVVKKGVTRKDSLVRAAKVKVKKEEESSE